MAQDQNSLGAFWQPSSGLVCVLLWGKSFIWLICHKAQTGKGPEWWLSLWNFVPCQHKDSGAPSEWTLGYSSPLLVRPFSGQFCFVTGFGRVLVAPNLPPFKHHEGNCFFVFVIGELTYLLIPNPSWNVIFSVSMLVTFGNSGDELLGTHIVIWPATRDLQVVETKQKTSPETTESLMQ